MALGVAVLGLGIAAIGIVGVVNPASLLAWIKRVWESGGGMRLAVGFRLAAGVFLLLAAPETRAPAAIRILGWVFLASAALIPVLGSLRLQALVDWWLDRPPGFVRTWGCAAVAFGGLLLYAGL